MDIKQIYMYISIFSLNEVSFLRVLFYYMSTSGQAD